MYLALALKISMEVNLMGTPVSLSFADAGYHGMCPVFATCEDAEKWSNGACEIIEVMFPKQEATE